jgi:hypothetical protein
MRTPESLLFAPSTIAMCALLLVLLQRNIDCSEWLSCIKDYCLPTMNNNYFASLTANQKAQALDIDGCMEIFRRMFDESDQYHPPSPAGVTDSVYFGEAENDKSHEGFHVKSNQ